MGNRSGRGQIKIKHRFFGDVRKIQSFGKELVIAEYPILHPSQAKQWEIIYNIIRQIRRDAIYLPQDVQKKPLQRSILECNCCGAEQQFQLSFENFEHFLADQISNRKQTQQYFNQQQLLYMLYIFLQASKQINQRSKSTGDIRTKKIIYTKKSKQLKIISLASIPSERTPIDRVLDNYDNTTIFYMAPEQIDFINGVSTARRGQYPDAKTQAFSIGLCILQAAILQSSQQLYDMKAKRKINQNRLKELLGNATRRFPLLGNYLNKICAIQRSQRLNSIEGFAILKIYSQKITQLSKFTRNERREQQQLRKHKTNLK